MTVQWGRAGLIGVVLAVLEASGALAATTYSAAPAGTGSVCSQAAPCALATALGKPAAGAGDVVQLASGTYAYAGSTLALAASDATVQGTPGPGRPVIQATELAVNGDRDRVADLEIDSAVQYAVLVQGANAVLERVIAQAPRATAPGQPLPSIACAVIGAAAAIRDSVCAAVGNQGIGFKAWDVLNAPFTTTLRNVTAIGGATNGLGVAVDAPHVPLTLDVANSIMRSGFGDVSGGGAATITTSHSDYRQAKTFGSSITPTSANGNTEAGPAFVSASDFHPAPGSPLVDAGVEDPTAGALDLDGQPRFLGAHTDIGAYEHVPAPVVTTGPATGAGSTSATLGGSVDPGGLGTSYHFEYGPTTAYGSATAVAGAGAGHAAAAVSAALAGLTAGTTYHYRLVATSAGGATAGADATFATAAAGPGPSGCCASPSGSGSASGSVTLARTATVSRQGVAQLKLTCAGGACAGKLALTVRTKVGRHAKTVKLGSASYRLAAGQGATLGLKLSKAGRKLLAKARKHKLRVTAAVVPSGGHASKLTLTLRGR